jgi:uncharacterized membrane protein YeiH
MDIVGVYTVACCTAFGGGTLRDLFLARHPLFWIENSHYPVIVFVMALLSGLLRKVHRPILERYLVLPDALGLGLFSITGAGFAHQAGTSPFVAALLGTITGTFGGVISDVICNEVPSLFRAAPLCATCSFTGCWVYLGFLHFHGSPSGAAIAGSAVIVLFRLAALHWNIRLPEANPTEP